MRILRSRLLAIAQEEADAAASDSRKAQVRTVDRSERIRTYNFPQNRITDHRIGYTAYNLDLVLGGELDARAGRARRGRPAGPAGRRDGAESRV
jgi:peptide chain release factor 1